MSLATLLLSQNCDFTRHCARLLRSGKAIRSRRAIGRLHRYAAELRAETSSLQVQVGNGERRDTESVLQLAALYHL
jgi:hypothetical protein